MDLENDSNEQEYIKKETTSEEYIQKKDDEAFTPTAGEQRWYAQTKHTVYYILGIIEILLVFRLVFKILGANPTNAFVSFLYGITRLLAAPFFGIFNTFTAREAATQVIFEPAIIIAMIIYALLARGVIGLVRFRVIHNKY